MGYEDLLPRSLFCAILFLISACFLVSRLLINLVRCFSKTFELVTTGRFLISGRFLFGPLFTKVAYQYLVCRCLACRTVVYDRRFARIRFAGTVVPRLVACQVFGYAWDRCSRLVACQCLVCRTVVHDWWLSQCSVYRDRCSRRVACRCLACRDRYSRPVAYRLFGLPGPLFTTGGLPVFGLPGPLFTTGGLPVFGLPGSLFTTGGLPVFRLTWAIVHNWWLIGFRY